MRELSNQTLIQGVSAEDFFSKALLPDQCSPPHQALLDTIIKAERGYPVEPNTELVPTYLATLCPKQAPFLLSPVNDACIKASLYYPFSVPGVQEAFVGTSSTDMLRFEPSGMFDFYSPATNAPLVNAR